MGPPDAPTHKPNLLHLLGIAEPQIYLDHEQSQWDQVLKYPTSLTNLQKPALSLPLGEGSEAALQKSVSSREEIG